MIQITIDAEMREKLHGFKGPVDFFDEHGQLLGRFVPYSSGVVLDDLEPGISADELRRRAENFQGRPLSELVARWENQK